MLTALILKTFEHVWKWTQSLLVLLIFTVMVWRDHELTGFYPLLRLLRHFRQIVIHIHNTSNILSYTVTFTVCFISIIHTKSLEYLTNHFYSNSTHDVISSNCNSLFATCTEIARQVALVFSHALTYTSVIVTNEAIAKHKGGE
jgi:hypothetical protein